MYICVYDVPDPIQINFVFCMLLHLAMSSTVQEEFNWGCLFTFSMLFM